MHIRPILPSEIEPARLLLAANDLGPHLGVARRQDGVSAFYEKQGFTVSEVAMERPGRR